MNIFHWFTGERHVSAEDVVSAERDQVESSFSSAFDARFKDYLAEDYPNFIKQTYGDYIRSNYPDISPDTYPARERPGYGLAISGGGIRSACLGIGVIQALQSSRFYPADKPTIFDKLSYLSTVSGGGYAGAALTWYQKIFNLFPFGVVSRFAGSENSTDDSNKILSYIRQHGKYLTPPSLGLSSLIASVLTSVLHSLVAYTLLIALLVAVLMVLAQSALVHGMLDAVSMNVTQWANWVIGLTSSADASEQILAHQMRFATLFFLIAAAGALVFISTVFIYAATSFLRKWFSSNHSYRVRAQRFLGRVIRLQGLALTLALLPIIAHFLFGGALGMDDKLFLSAASSSGIAGILLSILRFRQQILGTGGNSSGKLNKFLSAVLVLALMFFVLTVGYAIGDFAYQKDNGVYWLLGVTLVITTIVNINQISPHKMYRDRLMEAFLKSPSTPSNAKLEERGASANGLTLSGLACASHWAPYHLINCNVILNNASAPRYQGRLGDSFLLSPLYCGSTATGYIGSDKFANGTMTLATAMSISGAALSPHAGVSGEGRTANPLISFLLTFFGLRLGYWAFNPGSRMHKMQDLIRANYLSPGAQSLFNFGHNERSLFVELSDGGHFENTGIYELIRRRTPVIILSDGSADPDMTFDDFGNALERIRIDFGVSIRFFDPEYDVSEMMPCSVADYRSNGDRLCGEKYGLAKRGFAIGDIIYPRLSDAEERFVGKLVYIKSTLISDLPKDLYAYKAQHPQYPNQPTSDQFCGERQFEAYRELGYQLARQMITDPKAMAMLP